MLGLVWLAGVPHALRADEISEQYRIVGLFAAERQEDLRAVLKEVLDVQLVSVDMDNAEVTLRYDLAKLDPGFNPKKPPTAAQTLERLNNRIAHASHGSFRLSARQTVPKESLTKLEIDIGVLDCKACRYGAYRAVIGVDGVNRATVSATPSRITAWIDAKKTDRAALEKALTRVGVALTAK
jgi:hypothetical protein